MMKVMVWWFVSDNCNVTRTLFLIMFILVWLKLTQWLPSNNFGGFFITISLICWVHWSWSSTSCILVKDKVSIATLALGSQLRQGLAKVRAESEAKSHFSCSWECRKLWGNEPTHSQVGSHFGNWNPTRLPNPQRAISGVETHWIEKSFIPLKNLLYYWKSLETLMSKMGSHDPFEYLKHKLWPKKGWESNCQFDSWPQKVKDRLDFLACTWFATYLWKIIDKGYKFSLDLTSIGGLHKMLWASKVAIVPISKISKLLTGESRNKMTFGCNPRNRAQRIL
jgi:hypothetical protein